MIALFNIIPHMVIMMTTTTSSAMGNKRDAIVDTPATDRKLGRETVPNDARCIAKKLSTLRRSSHPIMPFYSSNLL